jgi:Protein of unknown function (DUF1573)
MLPPMRWILLSLVLTSACYGQLTWDKTELEFKPGVEAKNQEADFTFHNNGKYAVTLLSIVPSCGCTTATETKHTYAPGEKGQVHVVFDFGTRTGLQRKIITVQTSDTSNPTVKLVMTTHVPALLQVSPAFVLWTLGEEPLPKSIYIKVVNPTPIKILNVKSDNPNLNGELKTIKEGKEYLYVITPSNTSQAAKATYQIQTDFPAKTPRTFTANAEIKQLLLQNPTLLQHPALPGASATIVGQH